MYMHVYIALEVCPRPNGDVYYVHVCAYVYAYVWYIALEVCPRPNGDV
jgi:hypothetical protein